MDEKMKPAAKKIAEINISYLLKNPLEWIYIDRTIFLALISQLLPLIFGSVITYALYLQLNHPETAPIAINENIAYWYLGIFGLHYFAVAAFMVLALKIRKTKDEWPLFSEFVVYSWVFSVLVTSFMAGTYYVDGVLMLVVGFTLSLPLQDYRLLIRGFVLASAVFFLMAFLDITGAVSHGPLFIHSPYVDDAPWIPWHYARLLMGFICFSGALIIARVTIYWQKREIIFQEMSTKDGLTGLASRNYFLSRMETEFSKVQSRRGNLSFIMIDLDFFKKVNDTYGHQVGDYVLEETAKILMENARNYDEVGRYGGEEFAILLPSTSLDVAVSIAERIRNSFEKTEMKIEGHIFKVTASLGVASYPDVEVKNINDLLRKADVALYTAKHEGRNKVVVVEQKLLKSVNQ